MNIEAATRSKVESMALRRLLLLERQTDIARTLLQRLHQDIGQAGSRLGGQASVLLEANEQLVLAALRAQTETEQVTYSAKHDALTELPNRVLLFDRLNQNIAMARRRNTHFALLFLDLDRFKEINDALGHAVGDAVLKRVAQCLVSSVREADTVSRHGGDEFLILLGEISDVADAVRIADKIVNALSTPNARDESALSVTASIGISIYPEHGQDAETLIERADAAMYHAKRQGLASFIYDAECPAHNADDRAQNVAQTPTPQLAIAEHEHLHTELREANEHLVLAALAEQDLRGAAEQAHQQQTEFLAVLAHELRNPLGPISSAAFILGRLGSNEPQLLQLQSIIERQVLNLSRLVGDLLDVSLVKVGKLRLSRQAVNIARIIAETVDNCRPALQLRQQSIDLQIPAAAVTVLGDAVRLTQIFSNLINNASKYTPEHGRIQIDVEIDSDGVVIAISDNGIGITADMLPHIFEPFVRDAHATVFHSEGLGIGLTVVRELIEGHGGSVVAQSMGRGLGSRFIVTLPIA